MAQLAFYGTYGLTLGVIIVSLTTVYRLFLHRLRVFPGPCLAAITSLYKTYYEVFKGGELLQHLIELHAIYGVLRLFVPCLASHSLYSGPVIRIAPNELHFNHYTAYADIYAVRSRFTKEPEFYQSFGVDCSTFGAIHPQDSRSRRNMLNILFSKRAMLNIEPIIQEKVSLPRFMSVTILKPVIG